MKKLLFLFNPHAGKAQIKNKLLQIVDIMVKGGGNSAQLDHMAMPFKEWIELVNFSYWTQLNGNG